MSALEKLTHCCLIVLSLMSGAVLIERQMHPSGSGAGSPASALLGKHIEIPGADWRRSELSVAMYISSHCHFCAESTPFYRQLVQKRTLPRKRVSLIVVSPEPTKSMERFLGDQHITVDDIYPAPKNFALRGTPSLLLVDGSGVVRRLFLGELDSSGQQELLRIVAAGTWSNAAGFPFLSPQSTERSPI